MLNRFLLLVPVIFCMLSVNGCLVAESTYLKKVDEARTLAENLRDLNDRHKQLISDNSTLRSEYEKLRSELGVLAKENLSLASEKRQVDELLKAKSDTLSKNISELRQKINELEMENARLKVDISALQRVKEEKVKELSTTYEQLLSNLKNEIAQGQVTISELKGKLTVNMEAAILFDSGKADIKQDGLAVLGKMIGTLKKVTDKAIRIEGHTDNVQITGGLARIFPTNWELSAARAINVARYLQQQGLDPALLSATAFSEYRPVADNASREGRARNRRIELILVARD